MPRKKKETEPITGLSRNPERQIVQKSTPLYALWRSELTLPEFKILDTYLSRINSHDPDHRAVRFERGEIEDLLDVKKINIVDLKDRLQHLGTMVQVDDPTKTKTFRLISLFEQAECEQDEKGVWQVDLTCTPSAMKYIFNVENLGYLRYKLKAVTSLRSRYSYILFLYIEKNRFRRTWDIPLEELRHLLNADDEYYNEFWRFNQKVLQRSQDELNEKTECRFSYEALRKGRKVATIRFTVYSLLVEGVPILDENQTSMFDNLEEEPVEPEEPIGWSSMADVVEDAAGGILSNAEAKVIADLLIKLDPVKLPSRETRDLQIYDTAKWFIDRMNAEEARKKPIRNKYSYLQKMIQNRLDEERENG